MRKTAVFIWALAFIVAASSGCIKFNSNRQYKSILKDMEEVISRLREVEKTSGDMLSRRESIKKEACRKKLGLKKLHSD